MLGKCDITPEALVYYTAARKSLYFLKTESRFWYVHSEAESVVEELCMFAEVVLLSISPNNKQFRGEVLVKQPQSAVESFRSVRETDSKRYPGNLAMAFPSTES